MLRGAERGGSGEAKRLRRRGSADPLRSDHLERRSVLVLGHGRISEPSRGRGSAAPGRGRSFARHHLRLAETDPHRRIRPEPDRGRGRRDRGRTIDLLRDADLRVLSLRPPLAAGRGAWPAGGLGRRGPLLSSADMAVRLGLSHLDGGPGRSDAARVLHRPGDARCPGAGPDPERRHSARGVAGGPELRALGSRGDRSLRHARAYQSPAGRGAAAGARPRHAPRGSGAARPSSTAGDRLAGRCGRARCGGAVAVRGRGRAGDRPRADHLAPPDRSSGRRWSGNRVPEGDLPRLGLRALRVPGPPADGLGVVPIPRGPGDGSWLRRGRSRDEASHQRGAGQVRRGGLRARSSGHSGFRRRGVRSSARALHGPRCAARCATGAGGDSGATLSLFDGAGHHGLACLPAPASSRRAERHFLCDGDRRPRGPGVGRKARVEDGRSPRGGRAGAGAGGAGAERRRLRRPGLALRALSGARHLAVAAGRGHRRRRPAIGRTRHLARRAASGGSERSSS